MSVSRRLFLAGSAAGLAAVSGMLPARAAQTQAARDLFAAAWLKGDAAGFSILDGNGAVLRTVALPDRGHDVAADAAGRWAVAFARRPGNFAVAVDRTRDAAPIVFAAPDGRHFFGHGAFSGDGNLLYATENDYETAEGVIGVYAVADGFRRVGEFPSFGIDPHELLLTPDGRTLVVANGGIETHPDFGRAKLNLSSMQPSMVFIDTATGALIEKHTLPPVLSRLSTRHIDIDARETVWIGCQWEGGNSERPPLVLKLARGDGLTPLALPEETQARLANYVGSVAVNRAEGLLAVTSPHGNCAVIIDTATGRVQRVADDTDVCGVAARGPSFLLSSGEGRFGETRLDFSFDNHIARLPQAV